MFKKLFGQWRKGSVTTVAPEGGVDEGASADPKFTPAWHVLHHSVRGTSHAAKNMPNQDYADAWREPQQRLPVLLAIADGHGSTKSPRSDVGARLAVETALACGRQLLEAANDQLSAVKHRWEDDLPRFLVRQWKEAVLEHLEANPLLVAEVVPLEDQQGTAARKRLEENPVLAYGATLLLLAVDASFWAGLQLGDGDIVAVDDQGAPWRPMSGDARLLANETTSLCTDQAWQDVRTCFFAADAPAPALLMAATDGYSNSFQTPEGFLAVGPDLLDLLAESGEEGVAQSMPEWLDQASRQGSGDDVTLGLIFRQDAVDSRRELLLRRESSSVDAPTSGGDPTATKVDGGFAP